MSRPAVAWSRLKEALADALDRPLGERRQWLAELRSRDATLHAEVLAHLAFEEEAESRLPETRFHPRTRWPRVGDRVGRHVLEDVIGIGGSGIVYSAFDEELERSVALKVLQGGSASPLALQRFLFEARVLADLEHPGIAHVHEFGTHGDGEDALPYLVLERVDGARDLVHHARASKLPLDRRIRLLLEVCDAVGFAHRRGIVHRDLKADNVLVDSAGRVKLIDFGIAKVCGRLSDRTTHGELLGTLGSMSPEQCSGDDEVDTRSDVYGLGALAYELLCGAPPHEIDELTISGAIRTICEEPPRLPSALAREVRGDLEAILLKAVARTREDRYGTADELARDLRRHLAHEPVEARHPSLARRARLFVRRHRVVVLVASVLLLTLLGSAVAVTLQSRAAARAEARGRERAERVTALLRSVLFQASPYRTDSAAPTRRDVLDEIAARLDDELPDDLENRADLHATLGRSYLELGSFDEAEHHARRAVEDYDLAAGGPSLAGCAARNAFADVLDGIGRGERAEDVLLEARAMYRELDDVPAVFETMTSSKLARAWLRRGELERAEATAREVLADYEEAFPTEHPATAAGHALLGEVLLGAGRLEEAEHHARAALAAQESLHGADSLQAALSRARLARTVTDRDVREANGLLGEALKVVRARLAEGHPDRRAIEAQASSL